MVIQSKKLSQVCAISTGVTLRSSGRELNELPQGGTRLVRMKDIGPDNTVRLKGSSGVDYPLSGRHKTLQRGDLLLRSRGQNYTAALIDETLSGAVAVSPLILIRPDSQNILPEYLLWCINRPAAQRYLSSRAKGTVLKMIGTGDLGAMAVLLPPPRTQKRIAELFSLSLEEERLAGEIRSRRRLYIEAVLSHLAGGLENQAEEAL